VCLSLVLGGCSTAGRSTGPSGGATTDPTLPPSSVAFLATARQLGALDEDDQNLLLGLNYCGLARRGPIDAQLAKDFGAAAQSDRQQAAIILLAAAHDLCPDQASALTHGASVVSTLPG